jgi:hypothetical protein
VNRIYEEPPDILKTGKHGPSFDTLRFSSLVDRLESQRPMMKTISYAMNSACRAHDKLFIFPLTAY